MIHNMICESLETRMNCENENTDTKCINRILMVKNSLLELEKKIQLTLFLLKFRVKNEKLLFAVFGMIIDTSV